jgi:hypothetical protein
MERAQKGRTVTGQQDNHHQLKRVAPSADSISMGADANSLLIRHKLGIVLRIFLLGV